jgi:hypothetical protein
VATLLKRYFRFMLWLVKIGLPINLVAFPGIALYGYFSSWAPAEEVLSRYTDQTPVMVGGGGGSNTVWNGNTTQTLSHSERSYVLVPSVFRDPKIVTIRQTNHDPYEVKESAYGFLYLLLWYVICIYGTWWFWFRGKKSEAKTT